MGAWKKNKVDSLQINGGQEYTRDSNPSLEQLNAITNNSFYAVDKADEALIKANSAFENNGTVVRVANSAVTSLNFDSDPQTQINSKATQAELETISNSLSNKANANAVNISGSNLLKWQNKIVGGGVLWENANLEADFGEQTIELSSDDYDELIVLVQTGKTEQWYKPIFLTKGFDGMLDYTNTGSSSGYYIMAQNRKITCIDNTHYKISTNQYGRNGAAATTRNDLNIPYKVFGIKRGNSND